MVQIKKATDVAEWWAKRTHLWFSENPFYALAVGLFTLAGSFGFVGNFILYPRAWLSDPLSLVTGIVAILSGIVAFIVYFRYWKELVDFEHDQTLLEEIVVAVLILPALYIWIGIRLLDFRRRSDTGE